MSLSLGVARAVIGDEVHPLRFEQFSASIVSHLEGGARVITTSSNYDQGRDGKSVGAGPKIIVCCSLTDEIDKKVIDDAKKLARTTTGFDKLYFCSNQKLTEYRADELAASLGRHANCEGRVTVLGLHPLAVFASQAGEILRTHYHAEVRSALEALADGKDSSDLEHSLRLALSVAATEDAASIREGVWTSALRLVMADGQPRTAGAIAAILSNHLKLASALRTGTLQRHLSELVTRGEVETDERGFWLSEAGKLAFTEDEERVASSTIQGRNVFREAVEDALRQPLTDQQANAMWSAIQNSLATLLYQRGREVLQLMAPILGGEAPSISEAAEGQSLAPPLHNDIVEPIARAAAAAYHFSDQAEEVAVAISDLLHSGQGPAIEWLSKACFAFVCACSLGLETHTQAALEGIIERTSLVLDTDVVLTMLSADEPSHDAVNVLVRHWREFGGTVLVAQEVLDEVAHHAWIAQNDLDNVADLWPASHMDRQVLSKNAFVRGFGRLLEKKEVKPSHWPQWIQQFKGKGPDDVAAIRNALLKDRGFGFLPPPNADSRDLADQVKKFLVKQGDDKFRASQISRQDFIRQDKAGRDASLFAAIAQAMDQANSGGDGRAVYLITSSARFRDVQRRFRDGENFILSVPAASYMLSMVPGRVLGLTALRSFLFDGRWQERLSRFELHALRIVKRSEQFDLPWAKRGLLLRDLRASVESVARDRSGKQRATKKDVEEVEELWMSDSSDELPQALARALDRVAADRPVEARLSAAEQRVRELEEVTVQGWG